MRFSDNGNSIVCYRDVWEEKKYRDSEVLWFILLYLRKNGYGGTKHGEGEGNNRRFYLLLRKRYSRELRRVESAHEPDELHRHWNVGSRCTLYAYQVERPSHVGTSNSTVD